jgi:hypothetical protein
LIKDVSKLCKERQQSNDKKATNNQGVYDFHILYAYDGESMEEWLDTDANRNVLYVEVDGWFVDDTISISANGKTIVHDSIVQTEPSTETSAEFIIPDIQTIKQLSLKINSSQTVSFEIARKDFIFVGIRKHEKNIEVVFYKRPPRYE